MAKLLRRFALIVTAGLLVLVAGCGGDDDTVAAGDDGATTTTGPDTAVTSGPVGPPGDTTITWTRIEPRDDLIDPRVAPPDELVVDPDDPRTVLVHFYGGVQACYGARATVVDDTDELVRIRLEVGSLPEAEGQACIEIAEAQELAVTLPAPVGDRRLVAAPS